MSEPKKESNIVLYGRVKRIIFSNTENSFFVFLMLVNKERVKVVSEGLDLVPGEEVECHGSWYQSQKYGLGFRASLVLTAKPSGLEGIRKFLLNAKIKGLGEKKIQILLKEAGSELLTSLDHQPENLAKLPRIGVNLIKEIKNKIAETFPNHQNLVTLYNLGLSSFQAKKSLEFFGKNAGEIVANQPYLLIDKIKGIGFLSADRIARRNGLALTSELRLRAGLKHTMMTICSHGDCASELTKFQEQASKLLGVAIPSLEKALEIEKKEGSLVIDQIDNTAHIFPRALYQAEQFVATKLLSLRNYPRSGEKILKLRNNLTKMIDRQAITFSNEQADALKEICCNNLFLITGGPGVGKTTLVKCAVQLYKTSNLELAVCAPTGRAAKRLEELCQVKASTIHRLLSYDVMTKKFRFNEDNQLELDLVIVDEFSMVDVILFYQLLKAIPKRCSLLLIGDSDQLPSIGQGSVLQDIIDSEVIPVIKLKEIFRQKKLSKIIENSHRINSGLLPSQAKDSESDFLTIYEDNPEKIQALIQMMIKKLAGENFQKIKKTVQILTPMHRGSLGCQTLNLMLQEQLNHHNGGTILHSGYRYGLGDKIMQIKNNYRKNLFNGDIGYITKIEKEKKILHIAFPERTLLCSGDEIDEIILAYAITIHKSQGSEFPILIIPIANQHHIMLERNLLYTAVTRAQKLVILIGSADAITRAVKNVGRNQRTTKLKEWLQIKN